MTQHAQILKHLRKAGSITVREAMVEYSIQSLTKRIQELRELGWDIESVVKTHPVTYQKYVRYYMRFIKISAKKHQTASANPTRMAA